MSIATTDMSLLIVDKMNCIEGYFFYTSNKRSSQITEDLIYKITKTSYLEQADLHMILIEEEWHSYDVVYNISSTWWHDPHLP